MYNDMEQDIEDWYYSKTRNPATMYKTLCEDGLKVCCPAGHYGKKCTPCKRTEDGDFCSGRGKCNGEGYREGTGKCDCAGGFMGENCTECGTKFYNASGSCRPCDEACDKCIGPGPADCIGDCAEYDVPKCFFFFLVIQLR